MKFIEYLENKLTNDKYLIDYNKLIKQIWLPLIIDNEIILTKELLYLIFYGLESRISYKDLFFYRNNLKRSLINYNIPYKLLSYNEIQTIKKYNKYKLKITSDLTNILEVYYVRLSWFVINHNDFINLILKLKTNGSDSLKQSFIYFHKLMIEYLFKEGIFDNFNNLNDTSNDTLNKKIENLNNNSNKKIENLNNIRNIKNLYKLFKENK